MTRTNPNILATHQYISESILDLSDTQYAAENHSIGLLFDPSSSIPQPHGLDAELVIPHRVNDQTGEHSRFGPRTLTLTLRGETMHKDEHKELHRNDKIYHTLVTWFPETNMVRPVLARMQFLYTTRGLIEAGTDVYGDGNIAGIDSNEAAEEVISDRIKLLGRGQKRSYRRIAALTQDISLHTQASVFKSRQSVDFRSLARNIYADTKKPIPESLRGTPVIYVDSRDTIAAHNDQPITEISELTIDHHTPRTRAITEYSMTTFKNWVPEEALQNEFYGFFQTTPRQAPDQPFHFGIEASQSVTHFGDKGMENTDKRPQDDGELRAMVQPYIQAVTNLRRYANAAYSKKAA